MSTSRTVYYAYDHAQGPEAYTDFVCLFCKKVKSRRPETLSTNALCVPQRRASLEQGKRKGTIAMAIYLTHNKLFSTLYNTLYIKICQFVFKRPI